MLRSLRISLLASMVVFTAACASDPGTSDDDTGTDTGIDTGNPVLDAGSDADAGTDTGGPTERCGNGVVDPGEACDNGPDNSDSSPDACRTDCTEAACGDGIVDTGERCDDGNRVDDDECTNSCTRSEGDLCRSCETDDACGGDDDACVDLDVGTFCGLACRADRDCPDGFVCADAVSASGAAVRQCLPAGGTCEDCFDPDRDGYGTGTSCTGTGDCDQGDALSYPGADEVCDAVDNDCDGEVDEGLAGATYYRDADRDGFGDDEAPVSACTRPVGFVEQAGDCDDDDARVYSGAPELCDEIDNDCDEVVDNGAAETSFWPDADNDGFGDEGADATSSCDPIDGYVTNDDDCDDGNGIVSPAANEICDSGIDDDCDGATDCADSDCDGDPACSSVTCPDDGLENNDSLATASSIAAGEFADLVSCEGDDDFYALALATGDEVTLTSRFSNDDGDIDMTLLDAEGRTVAASTSVTDDEQISLTIASSGTYYVRVYLYADAGSPGAEYALEVDIDSATPTCRDDGYEDNDTRTTASSASIGTTSDLMACPGDSDFYAIDLSADDDLTVTASFSDADGDIDVRILNGDGTVVASGLSVTDDEVVEYTATRSGTYTIEVALYADSGDPGNGYDLVIEVDSATLVCDTDGFENNDTPTTAAAIGPGVYEALLVCGEDQDFYAVDLAVGDRIAVSVSFGFFDGDVDIDLRNPAGTVVASSTGLFATTESFEYEARTSGIFVVNVRQAFDVFGESTEYDMTVEIEEAPVSCAADRLEDNDTRPTARSIGAGSLPGLTSCVGDEDFYAVELGAGDAIDVTLAFSDSEGDIDLGLLDDTGALVASSTSVSDDEAVSYTALTSGTYFIRVYLFSDAGTTPGNGYDMAVTIDVAEPICPVDRLENNDSLDGAEPLAPELYTELSVCEDDEDWYRLVLPAGATVYVDLTFSHADGDVDLQLQNSAGTVLASSASVTDDESVVYTVDEAGTYYVRVLLYADAGDMGADYDLEIDVDAPVTGCADDDYEENDSQEAAAFVGEETISDLRSCADDDDFFTTYMITGETITVSAAFSDAEGDVDIALLDSEGAVVASSSSTSDDEQIEYEAPSDGEYTIRVTLYADAGSVDGNDYELSVSFASPDLSCPGDDRFEDNDSGSAATPIELGYTWGLIACADDADYYEVLLFAGETFELDVYFTDADGDIDVAVYGSGDDPIVEGVSTTDDEFVTFDVETTGYYTIEITHFGDGDGNTYEMFVSAF